MQSSNRGDFCVAIRERLSQLAEDRRPPTALDFVCSWCHQYETEEEQWACPDGIEDSGGEEEEDSESYEAWKNSRIPLVKGWCCIQPIVEGTIGTGVAEG